MPFSFLKKIFSREEPSLRDFESILGYSFRDKQLLAKALSHRSSVSDGLANERLEFLGDAVLGLVVSEFLFKKYPEHNEGNLTKIKAALVNETMLSKVAYNIQLGQYVFLSPEEEKSGGRLKPSIIADAQEAVLGAIYLDGGLEAVARTIDKLLLHDFERLIKDEAMLNYKGDLLERMQASGHGVPKYEVIEEIGPDHIKVFVISVSINGVRKGIGRGTSKKEAEQQAAKIALETMDQEEKEKSC
jgi:ribonuclease-3